MAKILVIDDEPQARTMLRGMLEDEGYTVVDAKNGKEGLERYRDEPTDLVITDIIMPEMEGIETILKLQRLSPQVKIIAISGGGRLAAKDCLDDARDFGAQYVFNKPIENSRLLKAIIELLG